MNKTEWPFFILRCFGSAEDNIDFLKNIRDNQVAHGHVVDEIWFCGDNVMGPKEEARAGIGKCREGIQICREAGIAFSYQQGVTLNHSHDEVRRDWMPDDAWAVDADGRRLVGLFCATSQFAKDWNRWYVSEVLRELHPESYWPDDDLRMSCKGESCFCDRCLAQFNQKFHHGYTREQLKELIFGDSFSLEIRREWTEFNRQVLGEFAKVYREAVEETGIACRLGIQTVYGSTTYDGKDYRPLLEGLSGPGHELVGIRPGAGYYADDEMQYMFFKMLGVAREASRCAKYGFIGQICYEAENYPHIGAKKSPESMLRECSFALSSGCDSLAVYWGADSSAESPELNDCFMDTARRYMPFLKQIAETRKGSDLAGLALYRGENFLGEKEWKYIFDESVYRYYRNSLMLSVAEASPDGWILDETGVRSLSAEDYQACFSKPVLMTIPEFLQLKKEHPALEFTAKVDLTPKAEVKGLLLGRVTELFEGRQSNSFAWAIVPRSGDVLCLSQISGQPGKTGTVVIPTEFGGCVILVQDISRAYPWTGYRHKAVLDALDKAVPGRMPARLLTEGMAVTVQAYRRPDGSCAGVYLLNMSIGETMPLTVAVRRPVSRNCRYMVAGQEPVAAEIIAEVDDEIIVKLPKLEAWQPMLLFM